MAVYRYLYIDLGGIDRTDPSSGCTVAGTCTRTGTTIDTSDETRTYTRADLDLSGKAAFLIEAVLTADAVAAEGERGPRLWARFEDAALPVPP